MYNSPAGWRSKSKINQEYNKLKSESAKKKAMKLQIQIRVKGFGWKNLKHAWSKNGKDYTAAELKNI